MRAFSASLEAFECDVFSQTHTATLEGLCSQAGCSSQRFGFQQSLQAVFLLVFRWLSRRFFRHFFSGFLTAFLTAFLVPFLMWILPPFLLQPFRFRSLFGSLFAGAICRCVVATNCQQLESALWCHKLDSVTASQTCICFTVCHICSKFSVFGDNRSITDGVDTEFF